MNFHGLWNGQGKGDTKDRLRQSRKIVDFVESLDHPHLLVGDFNLNPDSQSFRILNEAIPRDLIREFSVLSTRSRLYTKPDRFADYILASEGVRVSSFDTLPDEVSDHLALRLIFD